MNKKEIAESIFTKVGVKQYEAYAFIDLLLQVLYEKIKKGNKIVLSGFGTFKIIERKDKRVLDPNTGEAMIIPAGKIVKFFPSRKLKEAIRN